MSATSAPSRLASGLEMSQVQPQVKLVLMVLRFHAGAELVESLVMVAFLEVGQLVHSDHAQEFQRRLAQLGRHTDLAFGLEFASLYPRHGCVSAERVLDDLELAVIDDLAQGTGAAQEGVLELH